MVVSEESGDVSVARNGKLFRYSGEQRADSLHRWLAKALPLVNGGATRIGALRHRVLEWTGLLPKGELE